MTDESDVVAPLQAAEAATGGPLEMLRHWADVLEKSKRTILCRPGQEDAVRRVIERQNLAGMFNVRVSDVLPPGTAVVMDEQALTKNIWQNVTQPMTFDHPSSWWEADMAQLRHDVIEHGAQAWMFAEDSGVQDATSVAPSEASQE